MKQFIVLFFSISLACASIAATYEMDFEAKDKLFSAETVRCTFKEGTKPLIGEEGGGYAVTFDAIEVKIPKSHLPSEATFNHRGSARRIDVVGAEEVLILTSSTGMTFIGIDQPHFTTVYIDRDDSGKFSAVYSDHMFIYVPEPYQAYGTCRILG